MQDAPSIAPDSFFDIGSRTKQDNTPRSVSQSDRVGSSKPEHSQRLPSLGAEPTVTPLFVPPVVCTRTRVMRPPERFKEAVAFIAQAWDNIWDINDFKIQ